MATSIFMTPPTVIAPELSEQRASTTTTISDSARTALKTSVHNDLIKRTDLQKLSAIQADASGGRQRLLTTIYQFVGEQGIPLSAQDRDQVANEVLDEIFGLGPLEPLLTDGTVNDILVNAYDKV